MLPAGEQAGSVSQHCNPVGAPGAKFPRTKVPMGGSGSACRALIARWSAARAHAGGGAQACAFLFRRRLFRGFGLLLAHAQDVDVVTPQLKDALARLIRCGTAPEFLRA
jgi:hypothetical protein